MGMTQKFTAWLRRHRALFLIVGIVIGLALSGVWAFINAPINVNRMTLADWQDTKIQSIGTATIQKLEANGPYQSMADIDHISGIGPVKMAQIQRHFTTWDTARPDVWYAGFIIGLALTFGCGLALHIIRSEQRHKAKELDRKLFGDDKNVKR